MITRAIGLFDRAGIAGRFMLKKIVIAALTIAVIGGMTFAALTIMRPEISPAYGFQIEPSPWKFAGFLPLKEVPEPSGIVYHPGRDSFFVVDDGGLGRPSALYEFVLVPDVHPEYGEVTATKIVAKLELGRDLEGVTLNTVNGLLYVADEWYDKVYEVHPDGPRHRRSFELLPDFEGRKVFTPGGDGIEGIAFRPVKDKPLGGVFYLANQNDPTCVIVCELPETGGETGGPMAKIKITDVIESEQINLGEVMWHAESGTLWLSHAWMNLLQIVNPDTKETLRWESLPGAAQEGITLDADGRLWIAQDTGGVAVYER